MRTKSYEMDLCNGSIAKKVLLFTIPLILMGILQLLFNAADIVVIGRFAGSKPLAAVASTTSLISLMVNFFMGLSAGTNVCVARAIGAEDEVDIRNIIHTAITLALYSGIFLLVLGEAALKQLLVWMRTPEDVMALSVLYLRIYFLGMPVSMLYNFGAAVLRAAGDTRRPLYFLLGAGVINVILNLFFVLVCHLSVAGVAIATIVSQAISAGCILWVLIKDTGRLHLDIRKLRLNITALKEIVRIGLPAGLQSSLFSISNVMIQSSINSFGSIAMAGSSAASNVEGFLYVSENSFHQAAVAFSSQNLGAGKLDRIKKSAMWCLFDVAVMGIGLSLIYYNLAPQLIGIYNKDPGVIAAGVERLHMMSILFVFCCIMDVLSGCMRGVGYSVIPMLISVVGICGLRMVWLATVFKDSPTISTLYMSYPVTWIVTTVAHLIAYLLIFRTLKRK